MKVKICGLQKSEHVKGAVVAGADMIGFVFAKSSRQVTYQQANALASGIPGTVKKVGVFVNPTLEEVERASQQVPLDMIQLHGQESAAFVSQVRLPVIKALSAKNLALIDDYPTNTTFLIDTPAQEFAGGSGQVFNWQEVDRSKLKHHRFLLAGGLSATNVQAAITYFQPAGVDVSSGVETNGKKDLAKIQQFIGMAKGGN